MNEMLMSDDDVDDAQREKLLQNALSRVEDALVALRGHVVDGSNVQEALHAAAVSIIVYGDFSGSLLPEVNKYLVDLREEDELQNAEHGWRF